MTDLDAARKRISDLGDEKARLQGHLAGGLIRIQELEDERDALREGLEECIESFRLIIVNRVGDGRCDGRCDGCSECVARKAIASAQALLDAGEPSPTERCPICSWPIAKSIEEGCVHGNCSYRPADGTAEWFRVQRNRAEQKAQLERVEPAEAKS